jgi:signal transduction histidine kinase
MSVSVRPVIGSSVMRMGTRAATCSLAAIMLTAAVSPILATTADDVKAFADFSQPNGNWVVGELYIFCQAPDGVILAHGANPALIGRNFSNVIDPDGKPANKEINRVGFTYGEGWVHFKWPNPVTNKVQPKSAWVVKVNDEAVCGSGYYHD